MNEDTVFHTLEDFEEFQNKNIIHHRESPYGRIEEYDLKGEYIRTWDSSGEIANHYGIHKGPVAECARGDHLFIHKIGRIFLREGADIKERLALIEKRICIGKSTGIKIDQYDIRGNLVKVWASLAEAGETGTYPKTIKSVCVGKKLYDCKKRIWLLHGQSIEARLELIKQQEYQKAMRKSIDEYSKEGFITKHWKNASSVANEYGIPITKILDSCLNKSNSVKGKIFLFSGENIEERLKRIKSKKKIIC